MCTADGNFVTVEFTQNFGRFVMSSLLVHAGVGSEPLLLISKAEVGSKEDEACANRGRCDLTSGVCTCFVGFTTSDGEGNSGDRGDCGAAEATIIACPFRCFCAAGYTSGDCSVRTCPKGIAWLDTPIADNRAHSLAECSGIGVCNVDNGECACPQPFDGAACERLMCPPGTDSPCNGNGRCLTMAELALAARDSLGDPMQISYGLTPNNPRTWDFNKIQGCICDEGFEGFDCSRRSCPRGDDPRTTGQSREVQVIRCQHTTAAPFTLSFRGETSPLLSSTMVASDLQAALATVSTIGQVQVSYSAGVSSGACTLSSQSTNAISITFISALGDLPALQVNADRDITRFPVFTIDCDGVGGSVRGTNENAECSNKYVPTAALVIVPVAHPSPVPCSGVCDYNTGTCACFDGMASSNGQGGLGLNSDCGYLMPETNRLVDVTEQ
ncbi:hypothetical protein BBJ28_00004217 [Nothophytophthora sp. Chile5]|nr:hypothetical protein BBJ28_00004217 [Nothophytophthora sp. Chile5]